MPVATIRFPFERVLRLDPAKSPGFRRFATVLDHLPVTIPDFPARTPEFLAVETGESGTASVRVAVAGKAYEGYLRDWTGLPPEYAAARIEEDLLRRLAIARDVPPGAVLDDGRAAQEARRAEFEADAVMVGGRVYGRDPVPEVALLLDGGHVGVRTLRAGEPRPASWMRFPLDRREEALEMAAAVSEGLRELDPALDWRRGHARPVDAHEFTRWTVNDHEALAGLPLAEGGHGARFERLWAFAEDFVRLVTPSVGHFPDEVVRAFVDLRTQVGIGNDADESLETLARGILGHAGPGGLDAGALRTLRAASHCLLARMEGHEPRYGGAHAP